jgi:TatD DNase family protein
MLVDSHCHLNMQEFADDLPQVIANAKAAGVTMMQTICTRSSDFPDIIAIAEKYPEIYASFGIHPHEVEKEQLLTIDEIVAHTKHSKVIGIGETGLDYYYEHSKRDIQRESFINHIKASSQTNLPVIVHSRNADDDTIFIMAAEMKTNPYPGLIHCFSSSRALATASLDIGLYISVAGIITFKNAEDLRDTMKYVPLDSILIETDAPYLAPIPMRGKRNEPAFVKNIAECLAQVKEVSVEEIAEVTTENFKRLFSKASPHIVHKMTNMR